MQFTEKDMNRDVTHNTFAIMATGIVLHMIMAIRIVAFPDAPRMILATEAIAGVIYIVLTVRVCSQIARITNTFIFDTAVMLGITVLVRSMASIALSSWFAVWGISFSLLFGLVMRIGERRENE